MGRRVTTRQHRFRRRRKRCDDRVTRRRRVERGVSGAASSGEPVARRRARVRRRRDDGVHRGIDRVDVRRGGGWFWRRERRGHRRPVLPRRRQPRLRRRGLSRPPHLSRRTGRASPRARRSAPPPPNGCTSFHLDLLGLTVDRVSVGGAPATFVAPRRARAGHHAAAADRRRSRFRHRDPLPRQAGGGRRRTGPQRVVRRHDAGRRVHRGRAALVHALVPVQRPPDRPGDLRADGDGAEAVQGGLGRHSRGPTTTARLADGSAARTYRWRLDEAVPTYETTVYIDKLSFERSQLAGRNAGRVGVRARARNGAEPRGEAAEDHRRAERRLGALPGAGGGRHLRQRRCPVLAGDLHPARSTPRAPTSTRSCTRTATSGGATTSR